MPLLDFQAFLKEPVAYNVTVARLLLSLSMVHKTPRGL